MQAVGSKESNGSLHMGTCVNNFYCDIDLNVELIFDTVANAPCECTFKVIYQLKSPTLK